MDQGYLKILFLLEEENEEQLFLWRFQYTLTLIKIDRKGTN